MLKSQEPEVRAHDTASRAAQPPAWATTLVAAASSISVANPHDPDSDLQVAAAERYVLVSATIADAETLSMDALETQVTNAYRGIGALLARHERHAVRFWNFIPCIHAQLADGRDRYMVFNAGRFHAFSALYGSAQLFARALPTASAVGIDSGPLVIHALGDLTAGTPLENPRQVPAYSYSRRYGPLPPCFARATLTEREPGDHRLLIGGTASIIGEDSHHARDPHRQAHETFDNLAQLVASASARVHAATATAGAPLLPPVADPLDALSDLRIYYVQEAHAALVRDLVLARFRRASHIEFTRADLCRSELLVEIEGLARL
jgi:chorismate lyase / 3-hydroxybenzoate synthase